MDENRIPERLGDETSDEELSFEDLLELPTELMRDNEELAVAAMMQT